MSCRDICLINLDLRHRHLPEINKYVRQPQRPFKSQRLEDPRVGGQRASPPVHDHIWSQSGQQRLSASQHTLHKELDATNPSAACVVRDSELVQQTPAGGAGSSISVLTVACGPTFSGDLGSPSATDAFE